ncbi:MAG: hypothetical protein OXU96_01000 [Gammaproteobacteria bacterium]|nr:hypothetical protein [Gammaproteobacteria bacterium]
MSRKSKSPSKRKAKAAAANQGEPRTRPALRPFFATPPQGLWRGFVPCLLAAFALRAGVGLAGDWMVRPDEVFKYLEQAHRMVFGYGQVPWEFSVGFVTWLLPAVPAVPIFLCEILGLGHPDFYIPAVKLWNALLSLWLPAGMYLFGRRVMGEAPARLALLLGCFWHELVVLATHAFAEQYSSAALFAALVLLSPAASRPRLMAAGFLFGLVIALRFQYMPLVGVLGLACLAAYPLARWCFIFIGGVAAVLLWGAAGYLTWGRWWNAPRLLVEMYAIHDFYVLFSDVALPFYQHLLSLMGSSYGLYALAAAAALHWRRHWLLLSMAAAVLAVHMWAVNKEYSNVFVLLPLLWMLIAAAAGSFRLSRRPGGALAAVGGLAALASIVSFLGGVPNPDKSYNAHIPALLPNRAGLVHSEEALIIARDISRLPADRVRAVMWMPVRFYKDGAYYHSHHRVPMLFPNRNPDHAAWYEQRPANTLATHVVAGKGRAPPGFSLQRGYGNWALFVNDTPEAVQVPEVFFTDFGVSLDRFLVQRVKDRRIEFPEQPRALLFPGGDGNLQ